MVEGTARDRDQRGPCPAKKAEPKEACVRERYRSGAMPIAAGNGANCTGVRCRQRHHRGGWDGSLSAPAETSLSRMMPPNRLSGGDFTLSLPDK
jgi:hypothetical protein